jgi:hypothetical protein
MDPLSVSSAFASIVGLIAEFSGQRKEASGRSYEEFKAWLAEHRHDEIIQLLEQNGDSIIAIRVLLAQDRKHLGALLASIDRKLSALVGSVAGFAELAAAICPGVQLPAESVDFLRWFEKSGSARAMEISSMDAHNIMPLDAAAGARENFEVSDWRFFEDDIATLVGADLLGLTHNSQGYRVFILTRAASNFIRELDNNADIESAKAR